ncbi:erythroid membrane-associated protein-like isoform X1 [Huso huso]|uniref:Erythroid membrane-associated protein-like isoform X1 n=1 Tax=Huso huso TaxID=61971 RepID=A0ABR0Y5J2_HUSHU
MAWHCKFHTDRTILAAVIGTAVIGTAVIGTAVVFYVIRKSTKEKKDLQKKNDSLKKQKEEVEADLKELRRKTNTCGYVLGREWKQITEARVNVTLDPDTASPSLTVSEDGSRVRFTGERSAEWPSVLGREGFSSGRHYWEVEVGEKGYWVLGVSTHPHEKSIPEKPGEGYWLVRLAQGKTCTAVSQGIKSGDQSGDQILNLEKVCKPRVTR